MSNAFLANEHRKARKQHRCCECGVAIAPGETYWHYRGITDGDVHSQNTCDKCEELRNDVIATWDPQDAMEGFEFRRLGDYCHEDPAMLERWRLIWNRSVSLGFAKGAALPNNKQEEN